jgi:hypothetical protein
MVTQDVLDRNAAVLLGGMGMVKTARKMCGPWHAMTDMPAILRHFHMALMVEIPPDDSPEKARDESQLSNIGLYS